MAKEIHPVPLRILTEAPCDADTPPRPRSAAERLAQLRRQDRNGRRPQGLLCPYCLQQTAQPLGARCYQCNNPDCQGGTAELGKHVSMLIVDSIYGARLVTPRKASWLDRERASDPLAGLRLRD